MKTKKFLWTFALVCAAISCSDNLDEDPVNGGTDSEKGQKAYITINISTLSDGTGPILKGDPNDNGAGYGEDGNGSLGELPGKNEGMIHDINVFLVPTRESNLTLSNQLDNINTEDASGTAIEGYGYEKLDSPLDASTGGVEPNHGSTNVTVTMKDDLGEQEKNFLVYAIVNAGESLKGKVTTLQDLRDYLQKGDVIRESAGNVNDADKFVMSTHKMYGEKGLASIVTLSNKNTKENPANTAVYVERLTARIDLHYPEGGVLDNSNDKSPVKEMGTFTLTGYMIVNQWNGATKMFKQVSPVVDDYTKDIKEADPYRPDDPKKYLGDEIWKMTTPPQSAGRYNFVLSDMFYEKKASDFATEPNKWEDIQYYKNYFSLDLNNTDLVNAIPEAGLSYEDGSTKFYPIAYVRENCSNTSNQVNGFSTGVIFQTKFTPNPETFKMTEYIPEEGSISGEAKLTDTENYEFLTAEHYDGKEVKKLVYKDVKSVAARAFNITGDTHNLLKGFMNGWDDAPEATLQEALKAVENMSEKNKLSELFKSYLDLQLAGVEDLSQLVKDSDKKTTLTYEGFVNSQMPETRATLLRKNLGSYNSADIANLAEWYGVYLFRNGQSYHKYWIRHDDNNNDNELGVMEFAIVRNNVYQLSVKGVRGLGDPLPYTPGKDDPGTPDENNEISINVTIYVKDWVKRDNKDIIL